MRTVRCRRVANVAAVSDGVLARAPQRRGEAPINLCIPETPSKAVIVPTPKANA